MHHVATVSPTDHIVGASLRSETSRQQWRQSTRSPTGMQVDARASEFVNVMTQAVSWQLGNVTVFSVTPEISKFNALALKWKKERGITSSPVQMALCPSYQSIIAMGPSAVPLILGQLESEGDDPDHWFWALHFLTNADPVPNEARGNMKRMAEAWITWGRLNLYAW